MACSNEYGSTASDGSIELMSNVATSPSILHVIPIPRRRRGRPKTKIDEAPKLKLIDRLKEAAKNEAESEPAVYASTTKGGVKLLYNGHHFKFSFRKSAYSVFQCCYKENREECKVRVVCDQKRVYPFDGEHVHFVQASDKSVTSSQFMPGDGEESRVHEDREEEFIVETPQVLPEAPADEEDDQTSYVEIEDAELEEQVVELLIKPDPDDAEDKAITTSEDNNSITNPAEVDPTDFREKIRRRLQKALENKK